MSHDPFLMYIRLLTMYYLPNQGYQTHFAEGHILIKFTMCKRAKFEKKNVLASRIFDIPVIVPFNPALSKNLFIAVVIINYLPLILYVSDI